MNADPIAEAIEQVNAAGYFFNNLFQLQDGSWRCNLRSNIKVPAYTEYGDGADPVKAVHAAVRKMLGERPRDRTEDDNDIPAFLRRQAAKKAGKAAPFTEAESIAYAHADAAGADDDDLIGGPASDDDDLIG